MLTDSVWGIVMVCMGLVHNWAGLVATRVALVRLERYASHFC